MKEKVYREFKLTTLALKNSTTIYILTFLLTAFGIMSYVKMPKELFPEITMPTIYVSTIYPGNSPVDIENYISRPLEKEIKSVDGIKDLKSTSVQDISSIFVEFNPDVDVERALDDVKDAVDKAKKDLPDDLEKDPSVMDIDFSEFPIMNINLSGDFSIDDLKDYAEYLQDEIEEIDEIDKAEIKGVLEREIRVNANIHKMESREVSFVDIKNAIASENLNISGGDVKMGDINRNVRVKGEFEKVEEIEKIIVKHEKGNIVYLRDVAEVVDGYKDRESYARLGLHPVVSVDIIKKSGENLLLATDKIGKVLERAKKEKLPENLKITLTNDQSDQTRNQINNLENSIISGVILVILVLLFFLGFRNSLFVGMAIPLSMFISFAIMTALGITMNLVVLFALILALGLLVDNAIVVIENIYRQYEKGMKGMQAARVAVAEIALPIIASTATTLAAFFPLLFWDSLMGEFMKYLPMTLIIVLTSSLFVALVINPVFAAKFMKKAEDDKINLRKLHIIAALLIVGGILIRLTGSKAFGAFLAVLGVFNLINYYALRPASEWFRNVFLVKLENLYLKIMQFALAKKRPYLFLFGTVLLLVFSLVLLGIRSPKVDFFPVNEPKYVNVFIEMPVGTAIEVTDSVTKKIEKRLVHDVLQPYDDVVKSVVANVGKGSNDPNDGPSQGATPNKARITINFVEYEFRGGVATSDIMKEVTRDLSRGYPGVDISVDKNREGPPVGLPISIEIAGEDLERIIEIANDVKREIEAAEIPGIEGLNKDVETGKPQLIVNVDRLKTRELGMSTSQIGNTIRTSLFGLEVSKFKEGEDEFPIQLRLEEKYRDDITSLVNQSIKFRDAATGKISQIPISAVADFEYKSSYGSVKRKNLDRVVTLGSNVIEGYNDTEINERIQQLLKHYDMPVGYTLSFTGKQEEQKKSMAFLSNAMMIAVALIALILVTQFNSGIKPFIIIASVLFSTIGVFLGLAIFKMNFVVIMTGIGIVSLAGIVVNNAIVLIDYIDLVKRDKRKEIGIQEDEVLPRKDAVESVIAGGKIRLRPVLLTAITTVLGLIPLALGMNIDFFGLFRDFSPNIYFGGDNAIFWGPMAWTVIFGLTFSTFLTLVIVPVMYLISDDAVKKTKSLLSK